MQEIKYWKFGGGGWGGNPSACGEGIWPLLRCSCQNPHGPLKAVAPAPALDFLKAGKLNVNGTSSLRALCSFLPWGPSIDQSSRRKQCCSQPFQDLLSFSKSQIFPLWSVHFFLSQLDPCFCTTKFYIEVIFWMLVSCFIYELFFIPIMQKSSTVLEVRTPLVTFLEWGRENTCYLLGLLNEYKT